MIIKMDPAIIKISGNMKHKGNKQRKKELIKQIYTYFLMKIESI